MGLLDSVTQHQYYQGSDHGSYQFTSLDDIITQFQVAYVGEDKIISKIKRVDIAFHAQRAMQELSFDTFKSIKSQEIEVPATLQMILPQDYVNYTKISWVDSAGVKRLLYPTSKTSNPTNPLHTSSGSFEIEAVGQITNNKYVMTLDAEYSNILIGMEVHGVGITPDTIVEAYSVTNDVTVLTLNNKLELPGSGTGSGVTVSNATYRFTSSDGVLSNTPTTQLLKKEGDLNQGKAYIDFATAQTDISIGDLVSHEFFPVGTVVTDITSQTSMDDGTRIYVSEEATDHDQSGGSTAVHDIIFTSINPTSDTWTNYKSATSSENNNDNYKDDNYWPLDGSRYGLDPQHAQANSSFYIDNANGKIHFSSNISGKTVVLDYISDGLGDDGDMVVHKFAEEAMYKWIAYAIMSTRANVPPSQVNRLRREKFASIRTAKLRLSNIKLEELTQTLRGKSKHIKH